MEDREECCNSGCNSCVLDLQVKQRRQQPTADRANVFDGTYHTFQLIDIIECTENVKRFRFSYSSKAAVEETRKYTLHVPSTMHLFIRIASSIDNANKHDKNTQQNYVSRPYTPIAYNSDQLTFDILVKIERHGQLSTHFNAMKLQDLSEWKGCYGNFVWHPTSSNRYLVCICQGVAIAPMVSLISSILSNEADETIIYLVVCFRNLTNHLLRNELNDFRKFWNFNSIVYLSQEQQCSQCKQQITENCQCLKGRLLFKEIVRNYRLDANELQRLYRDLKSNAITTLFCGTDHLKNIVKTFIDHVDDDNLKQNFVCLE